jgi:hypothetical protein
MKRPPLGAAFLFAAGSAGYMRSIIAWPKPEHFTSFASFIWRAKS